MMMVLRIAVITIFVFLAGVASGQEKILQEEIQNILQDRINSVKIMVKHPLLIKAVKEQNVKEIKLEEIKQIDEEWKSTKTLTPFKKLLQTNDAGKVLKRKIDSNRKIYSEAFLTDNQGANVACYPATSDYWQGDEIKWIASFNNGNGKTYTGPIKLDESTKVKTTQISVPVVDGEKTIGVLVVGVKLSYLELKR